MRIMNTKMVLAVGTAALAAMTLSACSAGERFTDLRQASSSEDALPDALPDYATDGFDTDTVRFAGEHQNAQYFIGEGARDQICALVYRDADIWVSSCGAAPLKFTGAGAQIRVTVDGAELESEWVAVSANISVRER
jgi:hypothetical protein